MSIFCSSLNFDYFLVSILGNKKNEKEQIFIVFSFYHKLLFIFQHSFKNFLFEGLANLMSLSNIHITMIIVIYIMDFVKYFENFINY